MNVERRKSRATVKARENGTINVEKPENTERFGAEHRFKYMDLKINEMESTFLLKVEELEHKLEQIFSLLE